jgi:hypothetical protein
VFEPVNMLGSVNVLRPINVLRLIELFKVTHLIVMDLVKLAYLPLVAV